MPVIVTDFTWTQTEDAVRVHVPLKGARACKVDIISTDRYLKVHFPPFLFEAFLYRPVDENRSSAKIGNGVAVFTLMKTSRETWEQLMMSCDKETKQQLREEVLLKHQQKLSSQSRSKAEKQQAEKKYLLETMMKWLKNQAEARRSRSSGAEDLQELSENEKNPEWLKDKGE
uniref:Dynein axonemal assembly factor 4 n=1 Tax=Cynoglossus semilaevis TaxID=244447 RepID=A0A3P8UKZ5_CYNSE